MPRTTTCGTDSARRPGRLPGRARPVSIVPRMRLSVLDQSPISAGSTGRDALANSIDLARLADASATTAPGWPSTTAGRCCQPGARGADRAARRATRRIRVGSGGVMLPHYSPLKVAETFSLLAGLSPGRIDLGLGRAAATDPISTSELQRDRRQASPDDFFDQLVDLLAYLDGRTNPPTSRWSGSRDRSPAGREAPEPWMLGSSPQSAIWPRNSGSPTRSRTSSTRRARRSRRTSSGASTPAPGSPRRAPRWRAGRSSPRPRRRRGG